MSVPRRPIQRLLPALLVCLFALLNAGSATAATPATTEFSAAITAGANPLGITAGPDGNLWFAEFNGNRIGRVTPAGTVTEFSAGITAGAKPDGITTGPDGNLWFTERNGHRIGRITPSGTVSEFSTGITAGAGPEGITAGPDGNLWFAEIVANKIGRITPSGTVTEFSTGIAPNAGLFEITPGPDGNLWFTEFNTSTIGRITPSGTVTEFNVGITAPAGPYGIAAGPDGNLWFTERSSNRIGRITPSGTVTEFSTGITAGAGPRDIAAGPDGNLWFTEQSGDRIGRITPSGMVTEFSTGITASAAPFAIAAGPDGNLWFTENAGSRIGRINTAQDPPAFSNPASIAIPGTGTQGFASPYPSQIAVSGLQGTVTDVRVRLTGLDHTYPGDVDFLLVGPGGQSVLLTSDDTTVRRPPAAGVTLNLSDAAPFQVPTVNTGGPLVSGVFRPTNGGATAFPAPAPAGPYGSQLAAFHGTTPNGNWKLFVHDDGSLDTGSLRGGWGLDIDTTGPPPPPPPPPPDPLTLSLQAKPKQKAAKLAVAATCSKACDLVASANGKAGNTKLKSIQVKTRGQARIASKIKFKFPKAALKEATGEKGKATIKVSATDADGLSAKKSVKVKLK